MPGRWLAPSDLLGYPQSVGLLRELTLQSLSLIAGTLANSLHALRRPFRGGRPRVLLAGTNMMMARDLSRVREVLESDPAFRFRCTLRPFQDVDGLDPGAFARAVGAPYVSWATSLFLPWDLVCVASHARAFSAGRLIPKVYLGHGISGGKRLHGFVDEFAPGFMYRNGRRVYDRLFARGEDGKDLAVRCDPGLESAVVVVGDIIADELLELNRRRAEVRASLGISPEEFVVAVLSTHGPQGILGHYQNRFVTAVARLAESRRVLVVNHPFNVYSRMHPAIREVSLRLLEAPPAGVRVNAPEEPIGPALVAADMAISDHTSTALYFSQLGRPIIPLPSPAYPPDRDSPFWQICRFAPMAADPEGMSDAVARALEQYPLEKLREFARSLVAWPGEARARWRAELRALVGLDPGGAPEHRG